MRQYARVLTEFWTRGSGRELRNHEDARTLALYLFTCPHGNMIGMFYLAIPTVLHELGSKWSANRFREAMQKLSKLDIAHYDERAELVYLPAAARTQIGEHLSKGDKRRPGIEKELARFRGHEFRAKFLTQYGALFGLDTKDLARTIEGPSKVHARSGASIRNLGCEPPAPAPVSDPVSEAGDMDPRAAEMAHTICAQPQLAQLDNPKAFAETLLGRWKPRHTIEIAKKSIADAAADLPMGATDAVCRSKLRAYFDRGPEIEAARAKKNFGDATVTVVDGSDDWCAEYERQVRG